MNRYGVFSVTGYAIEPAGGPRGPYAPRIGRDYHVAPTTWYVFDSAQCGEVVFATSRQGIAKYEAFQLNAAERAWEKQLEHAQ